MMSKIVVGLVAISGALYVAGCGGTSGSTGTGTGTVDGTNNVQFATNSVTLPDGPTKFAWDLNGDGTPDDRLGALIGALAITGSDPQTSTNTAVASGAILVLFEETSTDATEQSATNAGVKLWVGAQPTTPPKYDGTDTFTIASTDTTTTQFLGNISGGTYTSADPAHMTVPVQANLSIALVPGQPALNLPLTATRVTFTYAAGGKVSGGQINGAITDSDLTGTVIPTVAQYITAELKADPSNTTLASFDTNGDGTVTAAEIEANPTISAFLSPDVQLFQNGVYKPNPANTMKDSLSVGLGFTGVGAMFTAN